MCENDWAAPSSQLAITSDEVHVWRASLQLSLRKINYLKSIIWKNEQVKANRFYFEKHRRRYTVANGFLRIILAKYLDITPEGLQFSHNRFGKPTLEGKFFGDNLNFNMSFSNEMALFAVTLGREIGVDIEYIRPFPYAEQIVKRYFSKREKDEFLSLPKHLRQKAFFTSWARKEAYIKARGMGLFLPLHSFSISINPRDSIRLIHHFDQGNLDTNCYLRDIIPFDGYAAAVAVEGHGLRFCYWICSV